MAITVKHAKTSTIPDGADTDLVRPSDWNADHTLTGLGTMAEQNANSVAITGGSINGTSLGATTAGSAKVTTLDIASGLTLATDAGTAGQVLTSAGAGSVPVWSTNGAGDVVGPASATDNAIVRFDNTTGKLIQNSAVTIDDAGNIISPDSIQFSGTVPATQPIGTLWFDSSTDTLNLQQNAITQQIGEEIYVYGKASNTISGQTLLQAVVKTGVVGASGVIQFGVANSGVTDAGSFIGVATEDIATNGFGRITSFGVVHGINTTGSTYGETWADGDDIWYNPTTGGLTKTKPSAPNIKVQLGTIIHAGTGGSGSFQVLLNTGSSLGGTDDNVQFSNVTSGQTIIYDSSAGYWKNASLTAGTGISVTNGAGSITLANTGVTSLAATSPVAVSSATGSSTISLGTVPIANGGTNGTATPTAGAVPYGTGTAYSFTSAGTSGQVLTSNGSSAPTWVNRTQYLGVLLNSGSTTQVPTSNGYIGILLNSGSTTQVPIS